MGITLLPRVAAVAVLTSPPGSQLAGRRRDVQRTGHVERDRVERRDPCRDMNIHVLAGDVIYAP